MLRYLPVRRVHARQVLDSLRFKKIWKVTGLLK